MSKLEDQINELSVNNHIRTSISNALTTIIEVLDGRDPITITVDEILILLADSNQEPADLVRATAMLITAVGHKDIGTTTFLEILTTFGEAFDQADSI